MLQSEPGPTLPLGEQAGGVHPLPPLSISSPLQFLPAMDAGGPLEHSLAQKPALGGVAKVAMSTLHRHLLQMRAAVTPWGLRYAIPSQHLHP